MSHVLVGVILPFAISSICLLGRFYSRAVLLKFWGIDDTLLLISWVRLRLPTRIPVRALFCFPQTGADHPY